MEHLFAIVLSFKSMGGCNNIKQRNQPEQLNQCVSEKAKKWGFQKGKALDCSLNGS